MPRSLPSFSPARFRTYVFRLPLFTRIILFLIFLFWILELQTAWNVTQWGALVPKEVDLGTSKSLLPCNAPEIEIVYTRNGAFQEIALTCIHMTVYRLNTYPLIHLGFVHAILNMVAITSLLERFEADHGTLLTAAMFVGRSSQIMKI